MKKIIPFFFVAILALMSFSCTSDDVGEYVDYDTYPRVYDLQNTNFQRVNDSYQIEVSFDEPMYSTDVMLVYLQTGTTNNNAPIWQQIPITLYLNDGNEVDYNFDFSMYDVVIYAGGTFDLNGTSFINNKTFRFVFVPADYLKNETVDYSNYNAVISHFNLDDSHPIKL